MADVRCIFHPVSTQTKHLFVVAIVGMRWFVWAAWKSKPASNLRLSPTSAQVATSNTVCLSSASTQHFLSISSLILLAPHSLREHKIICVSETIRKIVLFCSVLPLSDITWCAMHLSCSRSMLDLFSKDTFLRSSKYCTHYWRAGSMLGSEQWRFPAPWPGVLFFASMRLLSVRRILHHQHKCFIKTRYLLLSNTLFTL